VLVFFPGVAPAKTEWSLSDDVTLGRDRYSTNTADLGVAPKPEISADLSFGASRSTTPVSDTMRQFGIGIRGDASPVVTISGSYRGFTGDKAAVLNVFGDVVGESSDRIRNGTLGAKIGLKFLSPGEEDETPVSLRLDLGVTGGRETIPLWIGTPVRVTWRKLRESYVIRDTEYSAGLSGKIGGMALNASYARHHYRDNIDALTRAFEAAAAGRPLPTLLMRNILAGIRYNVSTAAQGQPKYDSYVSLTGRFLHDWALTVSFDYAEMTKPGALAREPGAELAWDAASWLAVRIGGYVVNQFGKKTRYATAGVTFYF
jgi:hypothetical protein